VSKNFLMKGLDKCRIQIKESDADKLVKYMNTTLKANQDFNLTGNDRPDEFIELNLIDSLLVSPYIPESSSVIDVGTGCGLPGIPLNIVRDDLDITLLDSLAKRTDFLLSTCEKLDLDNIHVICERAEILGKNEDFREGFDVAIARAVSPLGQLCELCLPLVKEGGYFIAMKGINYTEELEGMEKAVEVLNFSLDRVEEVHLPYTDTSRYFLIFKKNGPCQPKYPRRYARILKNSLF